MINLSLLGVNQGVKRVVMSRFLKVLLVAILNLGDRPANLVPVILLWRFGKSLARFLFLTRSDDLVEKIRSLVIFDT